MTLDTRSRRRAALSLLLTQPTAQARRPCQPCDLRCACARASATCTCRCTSLCPEIATQLTRHPQRRPVHAAYVRMLFELSALRALAPFWPTQTHYCRFPHPEVGASVQVRTAHLEFADLLAHHTRYLDETGALSGTWKLSLAPHIAGSDDTTFALEPCTRLTEPELARDLDVLAADLALKLRRFARSRLRLLGGTRANAVASHAHARGAELSAREREVLDYFLLGLSVQSIAERAEISPHTVRNHLKHLYRKLGVTSQRELRELFAAG